jgi:N-acetylglucosaminyldiphosphoundecaprenol N-acetyl-beta-D-mannosaminyltransferase
MATRAAVLGIHVDQTSYAEASEQIMAWARAGQGRSVVAANVHVLMEALDSTEMKAAVNAADLVVPDGMPLVWVLRLKGARWQTRVYGPSLMRETLQAAAREDLPVGLYGSTKPVLDSLVARISQECHGLRVVFQESPPFGEVVGLASHDTVARIKNSQARILFIGLGCPKQELWMASQREAIPAVMVGAGAAFDFLAGAKRQAPRWMQRIGMEWLFRLMQEPRRLWKRYLYHNPRFLALAAAELLGIWKP